MGNAIPTCTIPVCAPQGATVVSQSATAPHDEAREQLLIKYAEYINNTIGTGATIASLDDFAACMKLSTPIGADKFPVASDILDERLNDDNIRRAQSKYYHRRGASSQRTPDDILAEIIGKLADGKLLERLPADEAERLRPKSE